MNVVVLFFVALVIQGCSVRICDCNSPTETIRTTDNNSSSFELTFTPRSN